MASYKMVSSKGKKSAGRDYRAANTNRSAANTARVVYSSKKPAKRRTAARTLSIIAAILLVGVIAVVLSLGFYVKSLGTVFPNVWAEGVKLSGMTFEEARRELIAMGYENTADGVSATIVYPDGSSFSITGDEAGFSQNAEDAAKAAYDYGRGGAFFNNEVSYIKALMSRTDLNDVSAAVFQEDHVREVVAEHTKAYNDTLINDAITMNEDSIVIVKGITFAPADESEVYDLMVTTLYQAMADKAQLVVDYDPELSVEKEIDLDDLYNSVSVDPVDAIYNPETFSGTESSQGTTFDVSDAQTKLDKAGMGDQIVIPLMRLEPNVRKADIDSRLFRDLLAESTTYIGGNSNRYNNIVLAAEFINGTLLNPGEVFSFNDIVGQRTAERGFKEAGAYVGDLVVTEIGGGICQVSSTIYVTLLKADLEIVERQPHGMTVGYLPLGSDATINWGTTDLKFRNNTDYPIKIELSFGGGDGREITARLIGTKLNSNYIRIDQTVISSTAPQYIEREDDSIPPGQTKVYTEGSTGFVVDTYKLLYDSSDNLISTTLVGRSVYQVQNRVVLVSPKSAEDPDATPTPSETPTEMPTPTPDDTPAESPTPSEEPVETPPDTQSETSTEIPVDTPTDEPPEISPEEPQEQPVDEPPEEPYDEPVDEPFDEPVDEPSEPFEPAEDGM